MTTVSAVVVHFRGGEELDRCVASCLEDPDVVEVVVVDNEGVAPAIRRRHRASRVRVLAMRSNAGYGRAANAGLDASGGEAVLVLNQDVVLPRDALAAMLAAGKDSSAWIVGPTLVDGSGAGAPAKERFPSPLGWPASAASGEGWRAVPWVAGAAMLFMPGHTDLRFDRRIFMYGEDEELCWRVWRDGGRVVLAEGARVVHAGGTAAARRWRPGRVARMIVANRARMVVWHRGWRALPGYAAEVLRRRLAPRAR